ncbi:MAG: hypothetical protein Q8N01_10905 [Sulfuricurvum sp.]|nr:hypothetical protein [Sulfuricurvum sp.]MDP3022683.1 hypothetical protein [Sulfuricurvum sp.]MDP3120915.1 hypothetical protein [Sulfuricurvum sp.]
MIKFFFTAVLIVSSLHGDISKQMLQLYQKGAYAQACAVGIQNFKLIQPNEAYTSLYAFSCLNADLIDRLNTPLKTLNQSPEARANASYFSLLIMQKRLLIQALYDGYPLKQLKLPISSHLLSRIFDLYCKNPQPSNTVKEYTDANNPRQSYKLYTIQVDMIKTFAIDEYYDKILTKHHIYQ